MVRLLHLELLRETVRAVSKPTTQLCSRFSEGVINMLTSIPKRRLSDMERSTRLAEVQMIGNCNRITKLSQFH